MKTPTRAKTRSSQSTSRITLFGFPLVAILGPEGMLAAHVLADAGGDADQTVAGADDGVIALVVASRQAWVAARHASAYCAYGLQRRLGKRWSITPTSSSGSDGGSFGSISDSSSELSAEGDALGHGVGEGSEPEDAEAKEVDLGLADMSRPASHVSTSRGNIGLDTLAVKGVEHRGDSTVPEIWYSTCGHGRHRWQIRVGVDLARGGRFLPGPTVYIDGVLDEVIAARFCPRCGLVEVLE